jgi:hypothetical protein
MIFAIVYLGIYLLGIHLIYGLKSTRSNVFLTSLVISIGVFSYVFSQFKFQYRAEAKNLVNTEEKLDLLLKLNDEAKNKKKEALIIDQKIQESTLWRLSYSWWYYFSNRWNWP